MNFFKTVLASVVGFCIALIVLIIIGTIGIASFAMDDVAQIKDNSILELNFNGTIKDYVSTEQDVFNTVLNVSNEIGFNQILRVIKTAKNDSKIKAISINDIPWDVGWAQLTELRNELESFKQSGKKVWAYGDFYSQKKYYLASVADKLILSPTGSVDLKGLHIETMFYKDFQEKYGFQMEVIRHGKYKSAVEPFIANKMSTENREQISELINSLWEQVKTDIETSRGFDSEKVVLDLQGKLPHLAKNNNLIDELWYEDDYRNNFKNTIHEDAEIVKLGDYLQNDLSALDAMTHNDKVAVIYAQGSIIYGKGDENTIGQDMMLQSFKKAVENEKVKAIVLRINSGGGSALTSDLIWNAVEKAKKVKPVVVSMGNYAASGGYYIACNANKIFAEPTTITGSIGVFGVIPNANKVAKQNGINSEIVSTHANSSHYSVIQPLNANLKTNIKEGIEFIYDTFISKVAQGRNMNIAAVDSIAQGRVWTGAQAKKIGLVDELGSLENAVQHAASLAQINDYLILELPNYEMDFEDILGINPFATMFSKTSTPVKSEIISKVTQLKSVLDMEGIQARIPFLMEIK